MKAAQISEYGDPSVIHINDVPTPKPGKGQVLVKVQAASLNPFDTTIRTGYLKDSIHLELPITLGGDIAGTVEEVGEDVTTVTVGDVVYGQASVVAGGSGAFAEYAAAKAGHIAKAPHNVGVQETASLPLVGVSAWQSLTQHLQLQAGQKIFIHGGAGGIGSIAIQLAKHIGAYVAVTATGEDIAYVQQLGADEVIDYKTQNFADILHDFDAVFDTVGGDDFAKALQILKRGGMAVSMIAPPDEAKAKEFGVTAMMQSTKVTTEALNALRELVEAGVIKPHIGIVMPLSKIQEAFKARETSTVEGKVVLDIA